MASEASPCHHHTKSPHSAACTGSGEVIGKTQTGQIIHLAAQQVRANPIFEALGKSSPGASWNGSYFTDMSTGVLVKNYLLLYMDTIIFGKGYMGTTTLKVPEKYFTVKK